MTNLEESFTNINLVRISAMWNLAIHTFRQVPGITVNEQILADKNNTEWPQLDDGYGHVTQLLSYKGLQLTIRGRSRYNRHTHFILLFPTIARTVTAVNLQGYTGETYNSKDYLHKSAPIHAGVLKWSGEGRTALSCEDVVRVFCTTFTEVSRRVRVAWHPTISVEELIKTVETRYKRYVAWQNHSGVEDRRKIYQRYLSCRYPRIQKYFADIDGSVT